jgi:hypothetical protein
MERPLKEPIIPQSPRFTSGGKVFVVLAAPVATVPAQKPKPKRGKS